MSAQKSPKNVQIYTDGSCLGNPGPGGWAALLKYRQAEKMIAGQAADTTNNRMEITAVIEALKQLKGACMIELYTDSKYVMDGATLWLKGWKARDWKNAAKKPVKNQDLWQTLDQTMAPHNIKWHWVRGHSGHPENERVDAAARAQAEALK